MVPARQSVEELISRLAQHPEGFAGLVARMSYVPLLPLLEHPYQHVVEDLSVAYAKAGLQESDLSSPSLRDVVVGAIRSGSSYWAGLAVAWLEAGFPMDRGIAEVVDAMVANKAADQRTRHAAYRAVRRWERSQSGAS